MSFSDIYGDKASSFERPNRYSDNRLYALFEKQVSCMGRYENSSDNGVLQAFGKGDGW